MQMNDKLKQVAKLLWDFQSLREEQVMKICNCDEKDINCLIASKVITKDKNSKILKYFNKEINNRNIVAFDVVMEYLDRNPVLKKAKHPINVSMKTDYYTYIFLSAQEKIYQKLQFLRDIFFVKCAKRLQIPV